MILLESRSRIIEEYLQPLLEGGHSVDNQSSPKSYPNGFEITFLDFGDCRYKLSNDGSDIIYLLISFPSFNELKRKGLLEHLVKIYKEFSINVAEANFAESSYQLVFSIPKSSISPDSIKELSLVRRNCLAFPLLLAMNLGSKSDLIKVDLRNSNSNAANTCSNDSMYVKGGEDRVIVVLQTRFDDQSDNVLSRIFLQEFFDVRRQNSNLFNAPQVLSSKEVPEDIKECCDSIDDRDYHYITFILFPQHYEEGEKREKCINTIINFRDYFHYHLKCCKSYLHTRMRGKVADFLKVLNRSKNI